MNRNIKYFLLILMVGLMSCHRISNMKYVKEVDLLMNRVDTLQYMLNPSNIDIYKASRAEIDSVTTLLEPVWTSADTTNPEFYQNYALYTNSGRMISRVLRKGLPTIYTELELSQNQLKTLKHDLKKGLLTQPDSIEYYIETEAKAIRNLEHLVEVNLNNLHTQHHNYLKSKPFIDGLLKEQNLKN